jgi:hypothetical protein
VREKRTRRTNKELDSIIGWIIRYRLPTVDQQRKRDFAAYLYYNDRSSWYYPHYITYEEFAGRIAIIFFSTTAFGTGLGQIITEILR